MPQITFKLPGGKPVDKTDTPTNNQVVTFNSGKDQYDAQSNPGGGEANTSSNSGTGEGLALTKVGVDLPFKSLIGDTEIVLVGNVSDVTFSISALLARFATVQTWTAAQSFQIEKLIVRDLNDNFSYIFSTEDDLIADRKVLLPLLTDDDFVVFANHPETLDGKIINATNNTITNLPISSLANRTDGELITWDANALPAAVATGTANQVLTSNGAGTAPTMQRHIHFIASPAGSAGANNDSRFIAPFGSIFRATEAQVDTDIPTAFHIESITVNLQTNGKDGNTIVSFNDDTVSVISVTIATTATGDFSTASDVTIATGSNCDWEFDFSASTDGNTILCRQVLAVCF